MSYLELAQVSNGYETVGLNKEVIHTPCVIYDEAGKAANNAQSDFYSEAGMNIHTVTNAMYGMNNPQSTNLSYHITIYSHCLLYYILLLYNLKEHTCTYTIEYLQQFVMLYNLLLIGSDCGVKSIQ